MIEKCKYFCDSQSVCSLMIDDMVPVAVSCNGDISAQNDWGYLMDAPDSLYTYFNDQILKKYPEVKGTIFMPLSSPNYIPTDKGYKVFINQVNSSAFLSFLAKISDHFETAFHGDKHTSECRYLEKEGLDSIVMAVSQFEKETGHIFNGGKFPAYRYNQIALEIISEIQAKWWALDVSMINKVTDKNDLFFDHELNIVLIPTNVCGDIFKNYFIPPRTGIKQTVKKVLKYILGMDNKYSDPVKYLDYLYNKRLPIIVQEHFQSLRTDGERQTPSVYDDIFSLDLIYAFLRGKDIWYATCSDIAHYYESFIHSSIEVKDETNFTIAYKGIYHEPLLSIKLGYPKILHKESMQEIQGIFKNGYWIFNNISIGSYEIVIS